MKLFILLFTILMSSTALAQDAIFDVLVENRLTRTRISNAKVSVSKTGSDSTQIYYSGTKESLGRVELYLDARYEYKVLVEYPGMVSRFFLVNLKKMKSSEISGITHLGMCAIGLFPELEGIDYSSITDNPITVFTSNGVSTLVFDKKMAEEMAKKIEKIDSTEPVNR